MHKVKRRGIRAAGDAGYRCAGGGSAVFVVDGLRKMIIVMSQSRFCL